MLDFVILQRRTLVRLISCSIMCMPNYCVVWEKDFPMTSYKTGTMVDITADLD